MRLWLAIVGALIVAGGVVFGANAILGDQDAPHSSVIVPRSGASQAGSGEDGSVALWPEPLPPGCTLPPGLPNAGIVSGPPPSSAPEPPPPNVTPIVPPECLQPRSHPPTLPQKPALIVNGVPIYLPDGAQITDYRATLDSDKPLPIVEIQIGESRVRFDMTQGILLQSDVKSQDTEAFNPLLEALRKP